MLRYQIVNTDVSLNFTVVTGRGEANFIYFIQLGYLSPMVSDWEVRPPPKGLNLGGHQVIYGAGKKKKQNSATHSVLIYWSTF